MSRKHMPLLIGGAVTLLLALALGYWLFSAKGRYREETDALDKSQNKLNRLSTRDVFPSDANVETMEHQLEIYQDYLDGLFETMREGQRPREPINRDRFRQLLEQTLRRLVQAARAKSIVLPPDLAFGFQRYAAGNPPEEEHLNRLVDQLRAVSILCAILYEAGIGELVSVERTVFEEEALAAPAEEEYGRRRRNRSEPEPVAVKKTDLVRDPDGLFTRERYVLVYRAQDEANWKVLDRLSKGAPFVVITKMEIVNSARPAVVPPPVPAVAEEAPRASAAAATAWQAPGTARAPAAKDAPAILPRELRVVAGQELPQVRLEVDVYHFAQQSPASEGEENP
ncbi:MAG TPA: Amuc_1100 family pilus-like protein [Kiritimatiellia bacterium]|nr:Amuc_1100 family pilus-like protein [Kiritimatiellia bacterium]